MAASVGHSVEAAKRRPTRCASSGRRGSSCEFGGYSAAVASMGTSTVVLLERFRSWSWIAHAKVCAMPLAAVGPVFHFGALLLTRGSILSAVAVQVELFVESMSCWSPHGTTWYNMDFWISAAYIPNRRPHFGTAVRRRKLVLCF